MPEKIEEASECVELLIMQKQLTVTQKVIFQLKSHTGGAFSISKIDLRTNKLNIKKADRSFFERHRLFNMNFEDRTLRVDKTLSLSVRLLLIS